MDNALLVTALKCVVLTVVLLQVTPLMLWLERRGSAWMQMRLGPNRLGPFGLFQSIADAIKMMGKEDFAPGHVQAFYYQLAPLVMVVCAYMVTAVVPFAEPLPLADGRTLTFQIADLNVGILYMFAIASLGVYGIMMGGWASNSKYSLLGALRSSSQIISYELSLGLSVVGILMIFSAVDLPTIVTGQGQTWFRLGPVDIPRWGIFVQPLGFILFLTASYAETNRLPFDLPEGESEIVAGYHIEYGPMKFGAFMLAEYTNMFAASCLVTALFFGGWHLPPGLGFLAGVAGEGWGRAGLQLATFFLKAAFFMWLFVWVRWTLPRFRYDQLMDLGWKVMLPLALFNIFLTGILIYYGVL